MSKLTELLAMEAVRQQPAQQPAFAELVRLRRKRDQRNRAVAGAVLALALAAAGGSMLFRQEQGAPAASGDRVVVTGTLLQVGGDALDSGDVLKRGIAGMVQFQSANGTAIDAPAANDGRFSIMVPPGQYTVTGRPHYAVASSSLDFSFCQADEPVIVPGDGLSGVQVICNIR
ncbi:hypothetical protein [Dactylosporangium sp. NPDC048998]|uniref:hypothetical protein n=1 Tax=Dactylosporangium sp. NPDC048998 TaxID=3363976 RepID=UPI003712AE5A